MRPGWRWTIAWAAAAALGVPAAWAVPANDQGIARGWTLWTAGQIQRSGSVGGFEPSTDAHTPGLGLALFLRSPGGRWALRAHLEGARYHTSYTDIAYGPFVIPEVVDQTDLVWALAGPQWEAASWRLAPHVYAMAGVASLHVDLHPQDFQVIVGGAASPWLRSDVTEFATAIGGGVRWPLGDSHRFELTTGADYRWSAPLDYVTSPVTDASGNHLQTQRSSIQVVTLQLGLGVRWGGD